MKLLDDEAASSLSDEIERELEGEPINLFTLQAAAERIVDAALPELRKQLIEEGIAICILRRTPL